MSVVDVGASSTAMTWDTDDAGPDAAYPCGGIDAGAGKTADIGVGVQGSFSSADIGV